MADLMEPAASSDPQAARQLIDSDQASAAVIIPKGFTDSVIPAQGTMFNPCRTRARDIAPPDDLAHANCAGIGRQGAGHIFHGRRASAVFIIPAGINIELLQSGSAEVELLQQPNNLNVTIAERAVLTAIRRVSSSISAAQNAVMQRESKQPFASDAEKQTYFESSLDLAQSIQEGAPERVTVIEGTTPDTVEYDPRANSSAGQLITWVFIPLFGISALFAYERQQGTLRRLLTTPSRKATFLLGTISGQVAMALVQMLLLSKITERAARQAAVFRGDISAKAPATGWA